MNGSSAFRARNLTLNKFEMANDSNLFHSLVSFTRDAGSPFLSVVFIVIKEI